MPAVNMTHASFPSWLLGIRNTLLVKKGGGGRKRGLTNGNRSKVLTVPLPKTGEMLSLPRGLYLF